MDSLNVLLDVNKVHHATVRTDDSHTLTMTPSAVVTSQLPHIPFTCTSVMLTPSLPACQLYPYPLYLYVTPSLPACQLAPPPDPLPGPTPITWPHLQTLYLAPPPDPLPGPTPRPNYSPRPRPMYLYVSYPCPQVHNGTLWP